MASNDESLYGRPRKWALAPLFLMTGLMYGIMNGPALLRVFSMVAFVAGLIWANLTYNDHIRQLQRQP